MAERPIIFSAPMVRAILAGTKTQTRRIIKKSAALDAVAVFGPSMLMQPGCADLLPYAPGDLLWVRETWAQACELDGDEKPASAMMTYYRADGEPFSRWLDPDTGQWRDGIKWASPIHMPRWASRITLKVTAVKVEGLQAISKADVIAEGIAGLDDVVAGWHEPFAELWNSIHGPDAWQANPWVAAYSFERVT